MSDDVGDLIETERFHEIMTVKKEVIETKDEIDRARVAGRIDQGRGIELYQRKVRDYVLSIETVLSPANDDPSYFWTTEHIGEFELPNGEEKTVDGLQEFLLLPTTFEVEAERQRQQSYRHAVETETVTQRVRPPERLIEQAFRVANRAMNSVGFDLEEPSDKQKSGFSKIGEVEKATKIQDFLLSLDDDGLKELKTWIDREMLETPEQTNGHHEQG